MKLKRSLFAFALLLIAQSSFAKPVAVNASFTGVGPGVLVDGAAIGTLYATGDLSDGVLTLHGFVRTELDDNGAISVWTQDLQTTVDFALLSGDWNTTNCMDVSGPVFCALAPPSSGTWDSVSGTPFAFITTENGTTLTWDVTELTEVPTMSHYGIALTIIGLLLVATRRLAGRNTAAWIHWSG